MTEGPCRMRKKMMKNELFYVHYPYRPELEHPDNVSITFLRSIEVIRGYRRVFIFTVSHTCNLLINSKCYPFRNS
jgi:hypothetical protein